MKSLLLLATFISLNTFAATCPSINGSFICQRGTQFSFVDFTPKDTGYVVLTDGTLFEYFTDGKTYAVEGNEDMRDGKVRSYCEKNKFISDFTVTILDQGSPIAKQATKSEFSMEGVNLSIVHKIKMKGIPLPTLRFTCIPNSLVN